MENTKLDALAKSQEEFRKRYRSRGRNHFLTNLIVSVMFLIAFLFVMNLSMSLHPVRGNGMSPIINAGSRVLINKLAYHHRSPARGDIIEYNGRIARIIAFPEERVEIYGGHIFINEKMANETYLRISDKTLPVADRTKTTVPSESYFILCDNRDCYDDSRNGIFVTQKDIEGKVIAVMR